MGEGKNVKGAEVLFYLKAYKDICKWVKAKM